MSEAAYEMNVKGLDQLLRALKRPPPNARVGVLGGDASRNAKESQKSTDNQPNNAEVGAIYEFNDGSNPDRPGGSFLRVPIADHLEGYMEKAGAFDKEAMTDVIKEGSVVPWLKKVVVIAERIVQDAFDSGGFGKWKSSNMAHKKNHQTLVETKQLRESITSEVTE